jgi:moderate conductance mechanosensitive channel
MPPLLAIEWQDVQDKAPAVLLIIVIVLAVYALFRTVFPHVARAAIMRGASTPDEEMDQRANTIILVVQRTAEVMIIVIGLIVILDEIGVDITALITGLGIAGLAIALGTQTLVRDTINGIFLLAEDQYRTGDVVRIAEHTGTVETISLRRTVIRDDDGVVHSVPNGSIGVVSNYTRDFARVNVEVRVAYGEDIARVNEVIERVAQEMAKDTNVRPLLIEAPKPGRVESVGDDGVAISVTAQARPAARWDVAAELRRRLAEAFLAEGIRVPFASVATEDAVKFERPDRASPSG